VELTATWRGGRGRARWELAQQGDAFTLGIAGESIEFSGEDLARLKTKRRLLRHSIVIDGVQRRVLNGLRRRDVASLQHALRLRLAKHQVKESLQAAIQWHNDVWSAVTKAVEERRWIPQEKRDQIERGRPGQEVIRQFRREAGTDLATLLTPAETRALDFLQADLNQC